MKTIPLTKGQAAIVDDEDYEWLMTWKWHASVGNNTYYAYAKTGSHDKIAMHRLIMMYPKRLQIDHINHNGLDNRKTNLRVVTVQINACNRIDQGYSHFPGVTKFRNKWMARATVNKKRMFLGCYPTEIEAAFAYCSAIT